MTIPQSSQSCLRNTHRAFRLLRYPVLAAVVLFALARPVLGEASDPRALAALKLAVAAELEADRTDSFPWQYRDHDVQPGKDVLAQVIETPKGDLKRVLELNGQVLSGAARDKELARLRQFVQSPEEQARQKRSGDADDKQAREFLSMMPQAFVWTLVSETPESLTLKFRPNPEFSPPDTQSRVLGVMAGEMVIARNGNRIRTLRGTLTDDVKFGLGIFGKIDRGGTFNVERRELLPGHWQITETHVHIGGRALLFKTIGQQEDEVKTDWHPSTAPDLRTALDLLQKQP